MSDDGFGDFEIMDEGDDGRTRDGVAVRPFPNPSVELSPVIFLGHYRGRVVFASPDGEIRDEPAAKISQMLQTDIFACAAGSAFLSEWIDEDGKFARTTAARYFVRKCRDAGFWGDGRAIRLIGVWPGDDGEVILHRGSEILTFRGSKHEASSVADAIRRAGDGPLYRVQKATPLPTKPPKAAGRQWVRSDLDLWRFEPIGKSGLTGADIVTGFIGSGLLGAVAPFRAHVLVSAQAGSGKTTLLEYVHNAMSAVAGDVMDSFTEAGLRNQIAGYARPVLIDEAEAYQGANDFGVVERALELLRRMSTGAGGSRKQGDVGGGTVTQNIVGSVMMAAINPPKLQPADASRFLEIRLRPLSNDGAEVASTAGDIDVDAALERSKKAAPALLGLALKSADRYRNDAKLIKAALVRAHQSPRSADLVAAIAAGRRMLLHDEPLDPASAAAEIERWAPLLDVRAQAETVRNNGQDALTWLLSREAVRGPPKRLTIGDIVDAWVNLPTDRDHQKDNLRRIRQMGVFPVHRSGLKAKSVSVPSEEHWLVVANVNPELAAIFAPTPFKDPRRAFESLDDLGPQYRITICDLIKFSTGNASRAIAIPLTPHLEGIAPLPSVTSHVTAEDIDFSGDFS